MSVKVPNIILIAFVAISCTGYAQFEETALEQRVLIKLKSFVLALRNGEEEYIEQVGGPLLYSLTNNTGEWDKSKRQFLFGDLTDDTNIHGDPYLSLAEFAKQELRLQITWINSQEFQVYFVLAEHFDDISSESFWTDYWMVKYFACDFLWSEGELRIRGNLCFDATGGPFQVEYG